MKITGVAALWLFLLVFPLSFAAGSSYEIVKHDPDKAYDGTTLFADNSRQGKGKIVEIDMQGRVVWTYEVPSSLYQGKNSPQNIVMDVERLSNGDTLFNIQKVGFYRITPDGQIVFKHLDGGCSHDVDALDNGGYLYVRGWESKGKDHAVEIDAAGKTVWHWDGMKQFDRPPYNRMSEQGWIHVNSVTRTRQGNTLLSLRNFNMIVELNPAGNVVWERSLGKMKKKSKAHPHDPELQENGHIIVALTGADRVIEFTRSGGSPVWEFSYPKGTATHHIRDINILPNNNRLMVQADRILEVTPEKEVVWELQVTTFRAGGRNKNVFLYKAQRIGADGTTWGH